MGGELPPGLGVYYIMALTQSFVEKSTWTGYLSWVHCSELGRRRDTAHTTAGDLLFVITVSVTSTKMTARTKHRIGHVDTVVHSELTAEQSS